MSSSSLPGPQLSGHSYPVPLSDVTDPSSKPCTSSSSQTWGETEAERGVSLTWSHMAPSRYNWASLPHSLWRAAYLSS